MKHAYLPLALALAWSVTPALHAEEKSAALSVPFKYAVGKRLFEKNCGSCHGTDAFGSKQGPPLIHKIYEPSHHGDPSFYRAAESGTRQHHWNFGDMAPVKTIDKRGMSKVIPYLRWLQRENGIH